MIEQVILVRHGETLHNVAGIAQGWNDSHLSPRGREQVQTLAARLASWKPDVLFSSPLGRARSTAEIIAAVIGQEITIVDELREMSYGAWEGRSFLDVRREERDAYERWIGDFDERSPSGESHNDVLARMRSALQTIEQSGAQRPVVVSHGTAIRIAATALLDSPLNLARHLAQDNAALNVFSRRNERLVLKLWNDTNHCASV